VRSRSNSVQSCSRKFGISIVEEFIEDDHRFSFKKLANIDKLVRISSTVSIDRNLVLVFADQVDVHLLRMVTSSSFWKGLDM